MWLPKSGEGIGWTGSLGLVDALVSCPIWNYFHAFSWLSFFFLVSFAVQKLVHLIRSHWFIYVFMSVALGEWPKKTFVWLMSENVLTVFSTRHFIVSCLRFKSLSHFEFIFVYGVRLCSGFTDLHAALQFSQYHLLKRVSFPILFYFILFCFVFVSLGLLFWHIMSMYCIWSIYRHEHRGAYNFFLKCVSPVNWLRFSTPFVNCTVFICSLEQNSWIPSPPIKICVLSSPLLCELMLWWIHMKRRV